MPFVSRPVGHPRLVGLVDRVWYAQPQVGEATRVERILPTGRAQLILCPDRAYSVFVGPKSRSEIIHRRLDQVAVGVSFAAGAANAFVSASGWETLDRTVPLDSVMNVGSLGEHIAELTPSDVLDHIETELAGRIRAGQAFELSLAGERAIRNGVPAGNVASYLGQDRRRYVPEFRRVVGMAPKHYERVCRFSRSIQAIRRADAPPLAFIAAQFGFADQAHLTREIGRLAATSPAKIHRDATTTPNHIDPDKIFKN
ncbi:MAG: helix-turn-helix domain-containing protein [Acidimicrobiales bacterium]